MARIVAVHGIAQEYKAPAVLHAEWMPPLKGGVELAGGPRIADDDVVFPFYGYLFRTPGGKAGDEPHYTAHDVEPGFEENLLVAWWNEAALLDPNVQGPDEGDKSVRTWTRGRLAAPALRALSAFAPLVGVADRTMVWWLKQVHAYFHDEAIRAEIQRIVADAVKPDTRLMIGHSLGSVAAYEALCAHPEWPVRGLVTLGSPLGIQNLIFPRLRPAPQHGVGALPNVKAWTNVADRADIVALERKLWNFFGDPLKDMPIDNGATPHNIAPYLTATQTGEAIAETLQVAEAD